MTDVIVDVPIKRITDGGGFHVCWDMDNGYCPFFNKTICAFDGGDIIDGQPHAACVVQSKTDMTLQDLPVVACGEAN